MGSGGRVGKVARSRSFRANEYGKRRNRSRLPDRTSRIGFPLRHCDVRGPEGLGVVRRRGSLSGSKGRALWGGRGTWAGGPASYLSGHNPNSSRAPRECPSSYFGGRRRGRSRSTAMAMPVGERSYVIK